MVLEKTLESPLVCKVLNQSILKEINPEFIGRTDAEAPLLWPLKAKNRLIGKECDAGRDWGQEQKGTRG